jgi:hypothetical protein
MINGADLIGDPDPWPAECFEVTTEDARALDDILSRCGRREGCGRRRGTCATTGAIASSNPDAASVRGRVPAFPGRDIIAPSSKGGAPCTEPLRRSG